MLKEAAYVFRTAVGASGFTSGMHYWEIIPDPRTENELKIGVTTTLAFDYNTAFCDHVFGYAYYGTTSIIQVWDNSDMHRTPQDLSTGNDSRKKEFWESSWI